MPDTIRSTKPLTLISLAKPNDYFKFVNDTFSILTRLPSGEIPIPAMEYDPRPGATEQIRREAWSRLSYRQREVVALALAGKTHKEIAGKLCISPHTVKQHMQEAMSRIGVRKRIELILFFHDWDLNTWLNDHHKKG